MPTDTDVYRPRNDPPRVLVLSSSPRRNGNSRVLAESLAEGAGEAGSAVELVHLPEVVSEGLRDCRECRGPNGECTIDDGYRELFLDKALAADALVYATPLWWYGLSGHLKNFLDRMFCYISEGCPEAGRVMSQLVGKRAALVISAEESNLSARLAVVHQMQETCRYLHHTLVGIVVGTGNTRGEVRDDPTEPLVWARELGQRLFLIRTTDYQLDSDRAAAVWGGPERPPPGHWR